MTIPMLNDSYRRSLITGALAWGFCARPAMAITETEATGFIARLVADIDRVIAAGGSEAAMIERFESLFIRYADVEIMGQYALGVDGRSASAAQKRAFNAAFSRYISRKYGGRFRQFIGGRIEIEGARRIKPGYEITTTAHLKGESPIEVIFLVSDKSGQGQFFNMFIEGVNLLLTERAEIGAMLDRHGGNIDKMTADLVKAG
ncbi:phospholipid-binding protein MlaC [Sulfitobacter aestuarii]|uniref:Phospholipid-binding protein MlaC n=1 Tax=Sulfitobacter aestuarii TaxID=2161676 RepID=A0ABW5U863_9RHOB